MIEGNMVNLKRKADALRSKLQEDMEEIEERYSLPSFLDEISNRLTGPEAQELWHNVATDLRRNPLGWLLIGTGFTLLLKEPKSPVTQMERAKDFARELKGRTKLYASEAKSTVSHLSARIQEKETTLGERGKAFVSGHAGILMGAGLLAGALAGILLGAREKAKT